MSNGIELLESWCWVNLWGCSVMVSSPRRTGSSLRPWLPQVLEQFINGEGNDRFLKAKTVSNTECLGFRV